jgi:hypothetical protein
MKLTQKITLALGLLAASTGIAQTATASGSTGLLGQRYAEVNFSLQDLKHVSNNSYSLGASANIPLVPSSIDVGASYDYSWIGGAFRGHANTLGAYATAYVPLQGVKPFVGAGAGWQWSSNRFVGSDDQGLWGLTAGVEIPVGVITLTPRINYADDLEGSRNSSQEWTYAVEANYWINPKTAIFGSISKTDVSHSSVDSWNYGVGLRVRF